MTTKFNHFDANQHNQGFQCEVDQTCDGVQTNDDLVKRLRSLTNYPGAATRQAADRIEADATQIAILRDEMQRLREGYFLQSDDLRAAEARIAELEAALRWYHDEMCEGICKDLRYDSTYTPEMDDVCAGCKARAALGEKK